MGEKCFRQVFSGLTAEGMRLFNIITPSTRSFCHIDYIHEAVSCEPWPHDPWVPFLRVTNSYNRLKPLRFDLGFCRGICTNGMIFGKKSITFWFVHTRGGIARSAEFDSSLPELKQLEKELIETLHNLSRYYVPKDYMLPIVCRVFGIRATKEDTTRPRRWDRLVKLRDHVCALTNRYFDELGPTGYAALNVLTDLASHPVAGLSQPAQVNQFQERCADWADDFVRQMTDPKFEFQEYLRDYHETAALLREKHPSAQLSLV